MFDLSKNNVSVLNEAGVEFQLELPGSGESTGAYIKVRGDASPAVKNLERKVFLEYQMKERAAKRQGKEYTMDLDEAEDLAIQAAVVRIISWKNISEKAKEVEFTKENAERILKEHPWIQAQIREKSSDAGNFRPK